jgi:putative transposase
MKDYKENNNKNKYLSERNLRDQVPHLKEDNPFLRTVHSSPLKNTAVRLKESYKKFFRGECEYPKFRPWKKKWFSLLYDEPEKGFKINENEIKISLGKDGNNKSLYITGILKETLKLNPGEKLKTFRLCKKQDKTFYGVFTIEKVDIVIPSTKPKTWVAIDPNHKNFFVAVNNEGSTIEFKKLDLIKYWDDRIDELKSKRDRCQRKNKKKETQNGKIYFVPSKKWVRLNEALNRAYQRRREQIKQACYTIAHFLAKKYEKVVIGDYTPSLDTATRDNMHRSMLNQEVIGIFRDITKWVCYKSRRQYHKQDEKYTTSDCCICGDRECKNPSIREFICKKCLTKLNRDINSSVNIALKSNLLSGSDYKGWDLSQPKYTVYWDLFVCMIITKDIAEETKTDTSLQKKGVDELNQEGSSSWAKCA